MSFNGAVLVSQCTIHNFRNERLAGFLGQSMAKTTVNKRYFEAFYTIVRNIGHKPHVVNIKFSVGLALGINLTEKLHLVLVKVFPHLLYGPDVAEKLGTKVAIAHYRLTNHGEMGVD